MIERLTGDWTELEVTWNTRPDSDDSSAVSVSGSMSAYEEKHPDVTAMVATMLSNQDLNFGFQIQLTMESPYRRVVCASIEHPQTELHPTLSITYVE